MSKKQPRQVKKAPKQNQKTCIVGYKRATVKGSGQVHGEIFDKLEPCCEKFKRLFFNTGHQKFSSFNSRTEGRDGLNLLTLTMSSVLTLVLRISRISGFLYEERVTSCPFCEATVEVKCTKRVELIPKKVEVFSGYDEEIKWQEEEQEKYGKSAK